MDQPPASGAPAAAARPGLATQVTQGLRHLSFASLETRWAWWGCQSLLPGLSVRDAARIAGLSISEFPAPFSLEAHLGWNSVA